MTQLKRSHRGLGILMVALAAVVMLLIHGFSSWYVGQSLALEVAVAEAYQCLHLVCDSAVEESVEGFVRSAAIEAGDSLTHEEQAALDFGNSMRSLRPGQAAHTLFVPRNTRKAAGPLGVEVMHVSLRAAQTSAKLSGGPPNPEACRRMNEVFLKWSKVRG